MFINLDVTPPRARVNVDCTTTPAQLLYLTARILPGLNMSRDIMWHLCMTWFGMNVLQPKRMRSNPYHQEKKFHHSYLQDPKINSSISQKWKIPWCQQHKYCQITFHGIYIHNLLSRRPTTHSHSSEETSQVARKTSRPSPARPLSDPSCRHNLVPTHGHQHQPAGSCTEASCPICERGLQDYQQHYCNDGRPKLAYTTASPLWRQARDGLQDHTQPHSHPSCKVFPPLTLGGHGN